jgi:cation transport ATPase
MKKVNQITRLCKKSGGIKMKKHYKIEVDCASCALKMEEAAKKVEGITDAAVSFMTQKMKVEFAQEADVPSVMAKVSKACRKVEPDCRIYYENM